MQGLEKGTDASGGWRNLCVKHQNNKKQVQKLKNTWDFLGI
jgi:hypothetical protein